MNSFLSELRRTFLIVATKEVTMTDINKGAYVVNNSQKEVLDATGIAPGHHPNVTMFPLHIIGSDTVLTASYYGSVREGSGRQPEYRMGRFIHWLRVGDKLTMATDGKEVFVYKLTNEDTKPPEDPTKYEAITAKIYEKIDKDLLRRRAESANPKPQQRETVTVIYDRDLAVKAYVLTRSHHRCERPGCGYKGFIKADGSSYIEIHHIISLAGGGDDSILNVIALCPNCHKEAHYSKEREDLAKLLLQHIAAKTA